MASSSTPSSSITLTKKYDVFLSFSGVDNRLGFIIHLYGALRGKQIETFIDNKLGRGDEISPAFLKSIQESKIAVVIFSKDYASSKRCLRELAEIMKCKKLHGLIVLPVFYNVDPSYVRKQTGPFEDSFAKHENESPEEVLEWRKALTEAFNLPGWDSAGTRSESELIRDIVEVVRSKLMSEIENDFEGLIGIDKRIEQVMPLLCLDTMDVRKTIGIWGMGGIGKTTLAAAVFNQISGKFDGSCFIEKVGERLEKPGALDSLVHVILSEVLDDKNLKLVTPTILHPFIKERLNRKKVLIVLDDVKTKTIKTFLQLETLVEVLKGSGLGSRMIMISRDKQVLDNFVDDHDHIYEVDALDDDEALELFCNCVFKKKHPTKGFMNLSVRMVSSTKGNPLDIRVLGSYLLGKNKREWGRSAFLQRIGALTEASNLAGFDSSVIRPDSKLVGEIHKRIEHVKSLLCLDMKDVRKIIGIWGMGGVGKTTIARAVFNSISCQFDGACFIEKVGKRLENGGSDRLQLEVLSEVLHQENLKLDTPTIHPFVMELLNQKKVFIVLDDVNNFSQLETFAQGLSRCGLGSRIIITSRDKQVLCNFKVDDFEIHEEKVLDDDEALELFRGYANPTEDCMALSEKIVNYAKGNPLALEVLGLSLKGKIKLVWESALKNLQGVKSGIFDVLKISYDGLNEREKKLFLDLACFGDLYNYHGLLKEEFLDCLGYSLNGLVAKSLITGTEDIEMHDLLQEMGRKIVCGEPPKEPGERSRLWERNDVIQTLEKNTGTPAVEVISLDMDDIEDIHLSSQVFDKMHNLRFLIFHSMYGSDKVLRLPYGLNCLPDKLMFLHWLGYPLRMLPSNFNPKELVKLDLSGSNIEQLWEGTKLAPNLKWLNLSYCEHLTRIPDLSGFPLLVEVDLGHCESLVDFTSSNQQHNNLRNLNMSETAIKEVPSSIQSLTNLTELKLAGCTRLKDISTSICKLKSLSTLDLTDCSKLEIFPDISETMESLKALKLSAFFKINMDLKKLPPSIERLNGLRCLTLSNCKNLEMLPIKICDLTSLESLDLSYCSKLDKLPDNLGNLKSLKRLTVTGSAVGQLPSSITCLENLEDLDCSRCSRMEIPEDIDRLSSLKTLKLSRNMFERLPERIKLLSKLEFLSLSHCNMLQSLPGFPEGLEWLEAMDCDQLCQVPDASEFVRCINSKSHRVDFIFTNSLNLTAEKVSNVFKESLRIMQRTEKGSGKPPNEFSIYLPGDEIPGWFSYKSLVSSVNFQVLRNDLVNRKFMGFAICAVFGCDENNTRVRFTHGVGCVFKIRENNIEICNGNRIYRTHYGSDLPSIFIDSDHMLLGYCSFYSRNPIPAGDSDYVDISIEFKICDKGNQLKHCAVHPIYAEPIEIIGATIQDIGETSIRRSDEDNDEEVEAHPKRICTQAIKTP